MKVRLSLAIFCSESASNRALLEAQWDEICRQPNVERIVPVCHKADVLVLQDFLRKKFNLWAGNGSCVQEKWKIYKDTNFESIICYVSQKI